MMHHLRGRGGPLLAPALIGAVLLGGCRAPTPTEERVGGGTLLGAAGGAVIGAIAGNPGLGAAIGAGAGLAGGIIYDQVKRRDSDSYQAGYEQAVSRAQTVAPPSPFLQFNFPVGPPPVAFP
jgi:uncharacterized protein YcfJ